MWQPYRLSIQGNKLERKLLDRSLPLIEQQKQIVTETAFLHDLTRSEDSRLALLGGWIEYLWLKQKKPILFVENSLMNMLQKSKLDVDFENIEIPKQVINICFENGETFLLAKWRKIDLEGCTSGDSDLEKLTFVARGGFCGHDIINVRSQTDIEKIVNQPGNFSIEELEKYDKYFRLCCAVMIFRKIFPEYVKIGVPEGMKNRDQRIFKKEHKNLISLKITKDSPISHYRRWHFRTLRSERFKRDKDGKPRVIFVHETLVGKPEVMKDG